MQARQYTLSTQKAHTQGILTLKYDIGSLGKKKSSKIAKNLFLKMKRPYAFLCQAHSTGYD